jgi:hypothetical protein
MEGRTIIEKTKQKTWEFRKLTTSNHQRHPEQGPLQ